MTQQRLTQSNYSARLSRHAAHYQHRLYIALLLILGVAVTGTLRLQSTS